MPAIPLELPPGGPFVTPALLGASGLVLPKGRLPTHLILRLEGGTELWMPIDRERAHEIERALEPLLKKTES